MGNSLAKRYNLSPSHVASAGHLNLWKIYSGDRAGREVSVWVFERESLQALGMDRSQEELILRIMRADLLAMSSCECEGLIRALEVSEDTKGVTLPISGTLLTSLAASQSFAFVTERILYSLSDLLSRFKNFSPSRLREYTSSESLSDIEISRGLLNLIEGLQYLHTVQRKLHLSVSPESIVVTSTSFQWKLCGFGLSLGLQSGESKLASPYFLKETAVPKGVYFEPNLEYSSPEMTATNPATPLRYLTPAADVFSLGVILYEVYHFLLKSPDMHMKRLLIVPCNSLSSHQSQCLSLRSRMQTSGFPSPVLLLLEGMLQPEASRRFSLVNLLNSTFFNTGQISTLKAVEMIQARDVGTQASILTSLNSQIPSFPPRIIEGTILPSLCRLSIANPSMWTYVLPLHVLIAGTSRAIEYR